MDTTITLPAALQGTVDEAIAQAVGRALGQPHLGQRHQPLDR